MLRVESIFVWANGGLAFQVQGVPGEVYGGRQK